MQHYSRTIDVSGAASYPTDAQFVSPVTPREVMTILEDLVDDVYVSFDGVDDHAHLVAGTPSAGLVFTAPGQRLWLRRGNAGTAPTNVQVLVEYVS